jgi:hypothetical protein
MNESSRLSDRPNEAKHVINNKDSMDLYIVSDIVYNNPILNNPEFLTTAKQYFGFNKGTDKRSNR